MMTRIFCATALLLCLSGCISRGFGPIAVPDRYNVVPQEKREEKELVGRLHELQKPDNTPYRIMPGDQFNISVYEHAELGTLQLIVTPDGYISAPLAGPVKVSGLTLVEATDLLQKKLAKYIRKPIISLIPYRVNGYTYTILGRVNAPGSYPIAIGATRLIDAVAAARGLSQGLFHGDTIEMADLENAYISRNGEILPVNFKKALLEGNFLHNIPLKNGDYIYIPSVMNSTVVLLGEVMQQTYVGFKEGMCLLQALPFGRGLKETHNSDIKIIRGGLKNPVVYTVNIDKILNGKVMDFPLQANDIVYIPPDGISEWNIILRKIIPSLQALNMMAGPFGNPSGYMNMTD